MQTSYTMYPGLSRIGVLSDLFGPRRVKAKIARGIVRAGFGCFRVPVTGVAGSSFLSPGMSYQNPTPPVAALATALLASGGASSLSSQVISGTAFNGTYGAVELQPSRLVTLVLSSHANWAATTAVLRGYNHLGQLVSENLSIPSGGNTTLTSVNRYRSIVDLTIPAQSGTAGTFTVGVTVLDASINLADFQGVATFDPVHMASASNTAVWGVAGANSGSTAIGEYGDNDAFSCLEEGEITVYTEVATTDGDDVFVRVGSGSGGSLLGAFRNDSDTSTAVAVTNAKFTRASEAIATGGFCSFAKFK